MHRLTAVLIGSTFVLGTAFAQGTQNGSGSQGGATAAPPTMPTHPAESNKAAAPATPATPAASAMPEHPTVSPGRDTARTGMRERAVSQADDKGKHGKAGDAGSSK